MLVLGEIIIFIMIKYKGIGWLKKEKDWISYFLLLGFIDFIYSKDCSITVGIRRE